MTKDESIKDITFAILSSSPTCPPQLSLDSYLLLPGLGPFCNKLNGPFEVTIKPIDTSCQRTKLIGLSEEKPRLDPGLQPQGHHLHLHQQQSNLPAPAEPGSYLPLPGLGPFCNKLNGLFEVTIKPIDTLCQRAKLTGLSRK